MTEVQIVQLLGIVYAALGLNMVLAGPDYLRAVYADFAKHPGFMLIGGIASTAIGYAMVVHYTTWTALIPAIAAVVGWLALVKGGMILLFPAAFEAICRMMIGKTKFLNIASWFVLALGTVLTLIGFGVIG